MLYNTRLRFEIALGPELRHIADRLKADLGPSPTEGEVERRIDELLEEAIPNAESVKRRTKEVFRHALLDEMALKRKA